MKLLKAMATIAGFTLLSRVAGMIRDMLTASVLGASPIADAFFVALKLPNFFRRVAAEGAFSVSFIPLYSKTLAQEGEEEAGKFSGEVFSVMLLILSVFSTILMLAMPWVIHVIAPGFYEGTDRYEAAVSLTQITFPYLLLMSLVALLGGMLNAHNKFAPFSAAPIIFNLTLIAFMILGTPFFPTAGHAMAVGVSVSGIIQLCMMAYFVRRHKIMFHWQRPKLGDKTKQLFRLMGPGVLSAGVFQINLFVDMIVASLLPAGAISFLYYADRLNQLPLSMAGIAVGTALLPMLSKALVSQDKTESNDLFNRSLEFCFFVAIPSAVALLIIPAPMIATLFEHGKFTASETLQTSYVLMGYGIGLPAYIASKVFMTAFWAHGDTVTPVKISILTALSNVALCLLLIGTLGVAGISLATGLVGWMQVYLLHKKLGRKEELAFDERLRTVFPKIAICSCVMAIVLAGLNYGLQDYFHGALHIKILALLALIGGGAITYALAVQVSGVLKISDIKTYMKRRKG
ncbi:MAG TPA: murein biosynthesis integral membrane protein MurJ [Alphaproteobacteria bacterium]|nr:murein biosynthesis integral membrane protein MurJ [Alphaproteobacteria bacterium]